jgi:signal transduction histidine kinase
LCVCAPCPVSISTSQLRVPLTLFAALATGAALATLAGNNVQGARVALAQLTAAEQRLVLWMLFATVCAAGTVIGVAVGYLLRRRHAQVLAAIDHEIRALAHTDSVITAGNATAPADRLPQTQLRETLRLADASIRQAHNELRRHAALQQAIVDNAAICLMTVDAGGRIRSANIAAEALFDRDQSSLTNTLISDLVEPASLGMHLDDTGSIVVTESGLGVTFRSRVRRFGMPALLADVTLTAAQHDACPQWIVSIQDLTSLYDSESALESARISAEAARQGHAAFLSHLGHQVRAPLTTIIGLAAGVHGSRGSQLSERDQHALERVQESGTQVLSLVNDVIELAVIDSGHLAFAEHSVDVAKVLGEVVEVFHDSVADRPIVLTVESPSTEAFARVDPIRLRQILMYLIGNGVRSTTRGSVTATVQMHPASGEACAIVVRDTGDGLSSDAQAVIFESFVPHGEQVSAIAGGTGLGLALSHRIAQRMGCQLMVESTPGAGSAFTLVFPTSSSRAVRPDLAAHTPRTLTTI